MFNFKEKRRVLWPVTINAPSDDGSGSVESHEVKVLFELMTRSEAKAVEGDLEHAQDVLPRKIKGWEGIYSETEEPIPCEPDTLAALLDVPYIERAFAIGLIQASNGATAKNSKAGSDG